MTYDEKEHIKDVVKTKLKTSFIFPVAVLEEMFGHLWGHFERDDFPITERHRQWERLYLLYRKRVLDNGNDQIRAISKEIDRMEETHEE